MFSSCEMRITGMFWKLLGDLVQPCVEMLGLNLALTSYGKWSRVTFLNVTNPVISPILWFAQATSLSCKCFLCFLCKEQQDTEPSDDVSESNQKTCIKMKGLTNEK